MRAPGGRQPFHAPRTGASWPAMPAIAKVPVGRGVVFGGDKPVLIMGPCVIESEAHALKMARIVRDAARAAGFPAVFKASFDKATRSSHASFRGLGAAEG